jgi:signal transduction histidine kinase
MLGAFVVAAVILPRSYALTAFSDIVQVLLLASGVCSFIPLALGSRGRIRLFWWLITIGVAFWLGYQIYWTYSEVVLRRDVPDLCTWDIVIFLHFVPFMAALALRPHVPRDEYAARVGQLDFALLLVWWFYLYVLVVMPWQYVVPNVEAYNSNLNALYVAEKIAFLLGLAVCWVFSSGEWRKLYASIFGMSLCYSASSTVANWAIGRRVYYSGSLYDVPLVIAMAWLTWIGLRTKVERPQTAGPGNSTTYGVWVARFSMIAVFSLPLFAAWCVSDAEIPSRIRVFRLTLTLIAALLMGIMVFIRQRTLDRELIRLLKHSHDSFDSLQRLQAQILQSEKLASITQLVGGAAHELNNPITAMLGYSDLLLNAKLTPEQQPLAAKIGHYVRRTRSLVASLISFARQTPTPRAPLDLNTLARTAIKLTQPQWEPLDIDVRTQFDPSLARVMGDSNQLLQVCLQLLGNSIHVLSERSGRTLLVSSERRGGTCILRIATGSTPARENADASSDGSDEGLALSACQGILQEHRGLLTSEHHENGSLRLEVALPACEMAAPQSDNSTVPVLWQSRPFA